MRLLLFLRVLRVLRGSNAERWSSASSAYLGDLRALLRTRGPHAPGASVENQGLTSEHSGPTPTPLRPHHGPDFTLLSPNPHPPALDGPGRKAGIDGAALPP